MKIIFATHNTHKLQEVQALLPKFQLVSLVSLNDDDEVLETGRTFFDNAYLKANYYFKKYHLPTFADDSGLVIAALNGEPGVKSARYSGEDVNYSRNNELVLTKMKDKVNRLAYFVTVICFIDQNGNHVFFEGKWEGEISYQTLGDNGFGYDSIFFLLEKQKTVAQLSSEEKNQDSHRAKAFRKFSSFLFSSYQE
jgi:XTP/dITP diphosphohydrolase